MIGVDVQPVRDAEEAFLLMRHHLALAARYLEATDLDVLDRIRAEAHFFSPAEVAWAEAMEGLYPPD